MMQAGRRRPILLLSIAAILLALIGVSFIGAYVVLSKRLDSNVAAWSGPMREWVPAEAIQARLALLPLAGWSEQAAVDQSLAEGEIDTALSILAHSVTLSDRVRAGLMLRLASAYLTGDRPDLGRALYRKAGLIATLSPGVSDLTRIELLVQGSSGLIALRHTGDAIVLLNQAAAIVQTSLELKPAQRRQLAKLIQSAYSAAGDQKGAESLEHLSPTQAQAAPHVNTDLPLGAFVAVEESTLPDSLKNILSAREDAALQVIHSLGTQSSNEVSEGAIAGLVDVLYAEDEIVTTLSEDERTPATSRTGVIARWMATKDSIARQRFGLSLVPEWESANAEIEGELENAWTQYFVARRENELAGTPSPQNQALLEADLLKAEVLAGELGLIPGYDRIAGAQRLQQALEQMEKQGVDRGWALVVDVGHDVPQYRIQAPR